MNDSGRLLANRAIEREDDRPSILVTSRYMRDISEECLQTLQRANNPDPRFFRLGDALVEVAGGQNSEVSIKTMNATILKGTLDRLANFVKLQGDDLQPARVPPDVLSDILAMTDPQLPILEGIIQAPVFSATGTLITIPGYDAESGFYLNLVKGTVLPETSVNPTRDELIEARRIIHEELLGDFRFAAESDRAHATAILLARPVRSMISGPTPLTMVESPTPGTGKGLLVNVLTIPASGNGLAVMIEGPNEDEWRKRITAKLIQAPQFILIDNVKSRLDSAALSAALTSMIWEDRVLGYSRMVSLPVNCTWIATANNPGLSLEIARRTVQVRLDSGIARPWERKGFRHPDLYNWAVEHRGDLNWAVLTLIQAWIAEGKPSGGRSLGSYESWAGVMGGILDVANIPGFLANMDRIYAQVDHEIIAWEEFCQAWWIEFQAKPIASDLLFGLASRRQLLASIYGGRSDHSARTKFGIALGKMRDRVLGDFQIRRDEPDGHTKTQRYRLTRLSDLRGVAGAFSTTIVAAEQAQKHSPAHNGSRDAVDLKETEPEKVPQPPAASRNDENQNHPLDGVTSEKPSAIVETEGREKRKI